VTPSASERVKLVRCWARRLDQDGFAGIEELGLIRSSDYSPAELAEALRRAADTMEFNDTFVRLIADF
jgi:hypothetical protein